MPPRRRIPRCSCCARRRAAPIAANALLALQGEYSLRTADRTKGTRRLLEDVAKRVRAAPGPDAWSQALFTLEAIARTARPVGDWELAGRIAQQMIEHDPAYAGSHYALALVAEHDEDAATAKSRVRAGPERLGEGRSGPAGAGGNHGGK